MDTVTLTIDGKPVTVAKGTTVLQAAIEAGISVPYYCYHPGLERRRLLPRLRGQDREDGEAADVVLDGLHRRHGGVTPATRKSVEARAGVLEFLLVNHPLDCPVCDKGGECPLQDFSYIFGPAESRMDFPRRDVRRRRREGRRGLRADADAQPQPLHPVHAVRALHARDRRRRADRHRRSRRRQRDRHVPRGGRALAALGQPDGRVPGGRHHHARLPLQEPAVGQPERRRTPSARCARRAAARARGSRPSPNGPRARS